MVKEIYIRPMNWAQMSAIMEFIERKSATELQPTGVNKTYFELDRSLDCRVLP